MQVDHDAMVWISAGPADARPEDKDERAHKEREESSDCRQVLEIF